MSIRAIVDASEMQERLRCAGPLLAFAVAVGALALGPPAAPAAVSPANYVARPLCSTPGPGWAGCLALGLDRRTRSAAPGARLRAGAPAAEELPLEGSLSPLEVRGAYALPATTPSPQTIALVDAYDDANVVADLARYSKQFLGASGGPPACTIAEGKVGDPAGGSLAEGCFVKVDQRGNVLPEGPRTKAEPPTSEGAAAQSWAGEIATDVELAHGLCESCRVVLVEATSPSYPNLEAAENEAAALGAQEISNSWGGQEPPSDSRAFDHPGIVVTASAGDDGYLNWTESGNSSPESPYFDGPDYPASSPHVVAVGGTTLLHTGATWQSETVWNDGEESGASGGGCSARFAAPAWQEAATGWSAVGCEGFRAVADVAADADPYTGVAVYDSTPDPGLGGGAGWTTIGGTSVASPIIAATFALAGGAGGVDYPAATLYSHAGSSALHDVLEGGNGECKGVYTQGCSGSLGSPLDCGPTFTICHAATGYDGPTGVGTPAGIAAFQPAGGEGGKEETGKGTEESGKNGGSGGGEEGGTGKSEGEAIPGSGGPSGGAGAAGGTGSGLPSGSARASAAAAGSVRLTNLALTFGAIAALNRGRPRISQLAFTFTLSAPARVLVTLTRRVRVHGRGRWAVQRGSFAIAAAQGDDRSHLRSSRALRAGRYRLTLLPARGAPQSISIVIG